MPAATYALPIVDVGNFQDGHGPDDNAIAASLVSAFHDRGFAYITSYGVSQDSIDKTFDQARQLMSLPAEAKMKMLHGTDGIDTQGYAYPGFSKITQNIDADGAELEALVRGAPGVNESYKFTSTNDPELDHKRNRMPSKDDLPNFEHVTSQFVKECEGVYFKLLRILAVGLELDVNYFDRFHQRGPTRTFSIQHYLGGKVSESGARLNEHTDYGYITILFQDKVGGLEVFDAQRDEFIPAPPLDGAITVNVGDMMSRWTNGILRSTMHRVRAPPHAVKDGLLPERYSVPFFCGPTENTVVEPLPGTYGPDRPKLYEPVNGTEHIYSRQAKMYPKHASSATLSA